MKMFKREIEAELISLARSYPVVTVLGPRQSGKTTLVRSLFVDKPYVNLEELDNRRFAVDDPRGFLQKFPQGAVLDEIQRAPSLLSYIQAIVDEKDLKGMVVLTGSHQIELHEAVSQSLAGRTASLTLLPMNLKEIQAAGFSVTLDDWMLKGGYPRIYKDLLDPTKAYRNYFQTYVERDLRQQIAVKDLLQFERFVGILAGRVGQILNMEEVGSEIGLSSHTVKQWISVLEASFIVSRLPPYFENIGKRLIKSPKLYFNDVGLACYLLGIETQAQLSRDPLRGNLFENAIYLELKKHQFNTGSDANLYYYRDQQKNEVDFIFKKGRQLVPVEVKSSQTYHYDFINNIRFFQSIVKDKAPIGFLIYAGLIESCVQGVQVLNYENACMALSK